MQTRLRSSSNSQERRNSVSDIADFFQAKVNNSPINSPIMPGPAGRKTSGRAKDKEKEKELKTVRENIKTLISKMDNVNTKSNANGADQLSAISVSGATDHDQDQSHDNSQLQEDTETNTKDQSHNVDTEESDAPISQREGTSKATQTSEDEILRAIHELAHKYQSLDDTINDPKNGISYQLAKTSATVSSLHSEIFGAVNGLKTQLEKITATANLNAEKIAKMEDSQKRMALLLEENKRIVQDLKIMQGLVQKINQKTESNTHQVLDLTRRGMEQNLILHGVDDTIETSDGKEGSPMYTPRERSKYAALKFFKEELNIDIEVEDIWKAHRSGPYKKDKVRPLIVKVSYLAKDLIMEHVANLKGRSNPRTKQKYFVGEQIPEGIIEMKKQTAERLKPFKSANDKKPKEDRDTIQVVGEKFWSMEKLKIPISSHLLRPNCF